MITLSHDVLPDTHRARVLELLSEVGITPEADNLYVAHNGVVRVKVARMTKIQWLSLHTRLFNKAHDHGWTYQMSRNEFFIEPSDELTFRPPEAMR